MKQSKAQIFEQNMLWMYSMDWKCFVCYVYFFINFVFVFHLISGFIILISFLFVRFGETTSKSPNSYIVRHCFLGEPKVNWKWAYKQHCVVFILFMLKRNLLFKLNLFKAIYCHPLQSAHYNIYRDIGIN